MTKIPSDIVAQYHIEKRFLNEARRDVYEGVTSSDFVLFSLIRDIKTEMMETYGLSLWGSLFLTDKLLKNSICEASAGKIYNSSLNIRY